jgi:hypothetical protein
MNMRLFKRWLVRFAAVLAILFTLDMAWATEIGKKPHALHLVSVGITNAQGQDPLKATKKDALDVEKWAKGQQSRLFQQVHTQPLTDNEATRANILVSLRALEGQVGKDDYTILYMSAHGGKNPMTNEYVFAAFDGLVKWTEIHDVLRGLPGTKIIILDTCQAGAIFRSDSVIVYSACLANQSSKDGATADGNSLFTLYLLEALNGQADLNHNGVVSLAELAAYVSGKLEERSQELPLARQQHSTLYRPENIPDALPLARVAPAKVIVNVAPAPGPQVNPAVAPALAGTTWVGKETQGDLRFEFKPDGTVIMVDGVTPQPVRGHWTLQGNEVTIRFANCVYRGQVNGDRMTGRGVLDQDTWGFEVTRK